MKAADTRPPESPAERTRQDLLAARVARVGGTCPACRDALSRVVDGRCPACGTDLVLALDRRGIGSASWATGVLAAGVGSGFYLLTAPMIVWQLLREGLGGLSPASLIAWGVGLVVTGLILAGWLRGRRRMRRWSQGRLRLAAAATLLISLALVAVIAALD